MITLGPGRLWRRVSNRISLGMAAASADAFLASYPKSGRTWFRFILANYFSIAAGLGRDVTLHSMFAIVPNFATDEARGIPAFQFREKRPDVPLILVSHNSYRWRVFLSRPVIFMVRDPRDVMVSAYFHATRHKHRYANDISSFLRDPREGLPRLIRYINGWATGLEGHRHLLLSYEHLSAEPETATAGVLRFLGRPVDVQAVAQAVERSRFDVMRDLERREGLPAHSYDTSDDEALRMRRGKPGGFADYLTRADLGFIENTLAAGLIPAAKALLLGTGYRAGGLPPEELSSILTGCSIVDAVPNMAP